MVDNKEIILAENESCYDCNAAINGWHISFLRYSFVLAEYVTIIHCFRRLHFVVIYISNKNLCLVIT